MSTQFTAQSIEEYFGYTSRWMSTREGERIHYLDEGARDGTVVMLLHGSAIGISAVANFYLTIPALIDAGYRVIAPDMYGYGWTDEAPGIEATRPNHVDQICRMMDQLGIRQVYLIGNSLGGMIATSMAILHPQRLLGNIVIGTGGALWKHGSRFKPTQTSKGDAVPYSRELVRRSMEHLVNNTAVIADKLLEFRIAMAERPGAYEKYLRSTRAREQTKKDFPFDEAKAAVCPTPMLFIYGREDRVNPPEDALQGAESFPNADMMLFGHCGHWTMIERADDFNHLMLRFLSGYDQRIVAPPIRSLQLRAAPSPQAA